MLTAVEKLQLEAGEHLPTIDTLMRLSRALGVEVLVDIKPHTKPTSWVSLQAMTADVTEATVVGEETEILVAVG